MTRFLGVLSVILFWVLALALAPVLVTMAVLAILLSFFMAISSLVYEIVTNYLEKKK